MASSVATGALATGALAPRIPHNELAELARRALPGCCYLALAVGGGPPAAAGAAPAAVLLAGNLLKATAAGGAQGGSEQLLMLDGATTLAGAAMAQARGLLQGPDPPAQQPTALDVAEVSARCGGPVTAIAVPLSRCVPAARHPVALLAAWPGSTVAQQPELQRPLLARLGVLAAQLAGGGKAVPALEAQVELIELAVLGRPLTSPGGEQSGDGGAPWSGSEDGWDELSDLSADDGGYESDAVPAAGAVDAHARQQALAPAEAPSVGRWVLLGFSDPAEEGEFTRHYNAMLAGKASGRGACIGRAGSTRSQQHPP